MHRLVWLYPLLPIALYPRTTLSRPGIDCFSFWDLPLNTQVSRFFVGVKTVAKMTEAHFTPIHLRAIEEFIINIGNAINRRTVRQPFVFYSKNAERTPTRVRKLVSRSRQASFVSSLLKGLSRVSAHNRCEASTISLTSSLMASY